MSDTAQAATFQLEKIFVKDLSLEIPHAPQVFLQQVQPALEVHIDSGAAQFADGLSGSRAGSPARRWRATPPSPGTR